MRRDLAQQFKPLAADRGLEIGEAGDVAAGPREACDQAARDRVAVSHEHDRHGRRRVAQRGDCRRAARQDRVGRLRHQRGGLGAHALRIACGPAHIDPKIAAFLPAELGQACTERRDPRLRRRVGRIDAHQHADAPQPAGGIRRLREACERAGEKRHEIAAFHSIRPRSHLVARRPQPRSRKICSIFARRRSNSTGLVSKSSQPAASAFSRAPASACADSAMTGMVARRRIGLEAPGRLPAVDHRQLEIHQDQIRLLGLRHRDALPPVLGDQDLV